jgi:hypothetical protein
MNTAIKILRWASMVALALGVSLAVMGCDDDPGFGTGLDNGKLPDGMCADYPSENQAWALDSVVPPSHFEGDPKDLDLDAAWCNQGTVKSLFFILGYPT